MLNGIFVGLIFFHHFSDYAIIGNKLYNTFFTLLGQMIVSSFLFISGYGIFESIKNKKDYLKQFPKKRFLKLFINFSIAIIMFIIYNLIVGNVYDLKTILLSFIGWTSIGNSDWYIFATFFLYICILFSFNIVKRKEVSILLMFALSCIYILTMVYLGRSAAWYDTILCFPFGMAISYFKDNLAKVIVETIEDKNSIDLQRAEAAKQRALDRLNSNNPSIDVERARIALNKALNRIDIFHL